MANVSPLPASPTYPELVEKFHAALFRVDDALRRAKDAFDVSVPRRIDMPYVDRQLMLAGQYLDQARISLEMVRQNLTPPGDFEGDLDVIADPNESVASNPFSPSKGGA